MKDEESPSSPQFKEMQTFFWPKKGNKTETKQNKQAKIAPLTAFRPWGGTLGISGWGCAAGTLEPLTYTRASSAEFCYPMLE